MTAAEQKPSGRSIGRLEQLIEAWSGQGDFDVWVRRVSDAYFASMLRLEAAARLVRTTPAELQAVLNLASIEDNDLEKIARARPPKTTWLTLATASPAAIDAALRALAEMDPHASPYHTVQNAVGSIEGPGVQDRVAALSGATIVHMGKKATQYNVLSPNQRKALLDIGKRKRTGTSLTPPQVAYLTSLLQQLREAGAIKPDSPDGDQQECDAVLAALAQ
jgi:hypothetical protein